MRKTAILLTGALLACGGSQSTSTPTTGGEPAAQPSPDWWCLAFSADQNGICKPGQAACEAMRTVLAQDAGEEQPGPCAATPNPICLDASANGASEHYCHPTYGTCRTHADFLVGDGVNVTTCAPTVAGSAVNTENWWCVALTQSPIGSCVRSRERCDQDRRKLQELGAGEPPACAAQAEAECFTAPRADGSPTVYCQPTTKVCEFARKSAQRSAQGAAVSECAPKS